MERAHGPPPLPRLPPALRGARALLRHRRRGAQAGVPALRGGDEGAAVPRPLDRLERQGEGPQAAPHGREPAASRVSVGAVEIPGVLGAGHDGPAAGGRPGAPPRLAARPLRDVRRRDAVQGVVLPRGRPGARRGDRRQGRVPRGEVPQGRLRDAAARGRAGDPARAAGGRGAEAADARAGRGRRFSKRFETPGAAATAVAAREKLDEAAFRRLHAGILASAPEATPWKGRRVLAVDGSGIALPRELADHGFRVADGARHPQGMAAPCRLRDRIPVGFDLFRHENERTAALAHLDRAAEGDVIVRDRGCRSFAMAIARLERGTDFVFRLRQAAGPAFDAFIASSETDRTVTLDAPRDGTALRGRTLRRPGAVRHLPRPPGRGGDVQEREGRDRTVPRQVGARRPPGPLRRLRPAHARSAGPFLSERQESSSECHRSEECRAPPGAAGGARPASGACIRPAVPVRVAFLPGARSCAMMR